MREKISTSLGEQPLLRVSHLSLSKSSTSISPSSYNIYDMKQFRKYSATQIRMEIYEKN